MAAGDVDVRIVNNVLADIDTAVTAQRVLCGISGAYMMTSIGPQKNQVVVAAVQLT